MNMHNSNLSHLFIKCLANAQLIVLSACASTGTSEKPVAEKEPVAAAPASAAESANTGKIAFTDTDIFDRQLSSTLEKSNQPVELFLISKPSINEIPKRMNDWLTAVNDSQGKVNFKFNPQIKSIFSVASLLGSAARSIKEYILFSPAKKYDVDIYVNDGLVERIVFTRRK